MFPICSQYFSIFFQYCPILQLFNRFSICFQYLSIFFKHATCRQIQPNMGIWPRKIVISPNSAVFGQITAKKWSYGVPGIYIYMRVWIGVVVHASYHFLPWNIESETVPRSIHLSIITTWGYTPSSVKPKCHSLLFIWILYNYINLYIYRYLIYASYLHISYHISHCIPMMSPGNWLTQLRQPLGLCAIQEGSPVAWRSAMIWWYDQWEWLRILKWCRYCTIVPFFGPYELWGYYLKFRPENCWPYIW